MLERGEMKHAIARFHSLAEPRSAHLKTRMQAVRIEDDCVLRNLKVEFR
jgi:hypothetical protein